MRESMMVLIAILIVFAIMLKVIDVRTRRWILPERRPMTDKTKTTAGTDSLIGTKVAWAKLVLLKKGFDITAEEANEWLPAMAGENEADDLTETDLATAREQLEAASPGKGFLRKRDLLSSLVEVLFLTPEGQESVHEAIRERRLPKEILAKFSDSMAR